MYVIAQYAFPKTSIIAELISRSIAVYGCAAFSRHTDEGNVQRNFLILLAGGLRRRGSRQWYRIAAIDERYYPPCDPRL